MTQFLSELRWLLSVCLDYSAKKAVRKKTNVFGEEAEKQSHYKMCGLLRRNTAMPEVLGKFSKLRGGPLRHLCPCFSWLQFFGISEKSMKNFLRWELARIRFFVQEEVLK